ncbi:lactonase family protein [Clostridium gasigenes]|uniref:lactonase family protein n=1 Tax=Clostridium gasigenes TaxID=94869 RepID=UPI001C0B6ADF|nr:lactonase family protein [Clostridium gasigenes]MBU3133089.1 lactonase family protein [Clostridium gasigenes]
MNTYRGYIGTYTKGESEGIYNFSLDNTTGLISNISLASKIENPTYLKINSNTRKLYSVIKLNNENNNICGGVASFNINDDFTLTYLNSSSSSGKPPCYVSLDNINNTVFSGNYHEKNIISYSLKETGELNNIISEIIHKDKSHIHFVDLTPDKKYLCAVDLGHDEVILYNYNQGFIGNGLILKVKKGSGPRHIIFHPNGKFAYLICESSSEIVILSYDSILGFSILNYISTVPENFNGINSAAAIRISSDGKFLYGSNRGDNSLVVYSICNSTGNLTLINIYKTYGDGPRDFNLTPNEDFIVICNELTNNLTVYKRDILNGTLSLIQKNINVPTPVCITFL